VSFDLEPAVSFQCWDRLPGDHWRPVKIGAKTDEYFKVFLQKNHDSWVFYYDGEEFPKRTGFWNGDGVFENILLTLSRLDF
jgi:hypothetical protein